MKRILSLALVLFALLPLGAFAFDLTINPYSADNIGNVLASSGFPTFQTKNTGVNVCTTFDFKEAGKLTAGLDTYLMFKASSPAAYDTYVDPYATYAISMFSAKLELPLDVLSSTANWSVFPSFVLTPSAKFAIDKASAITGSAKTTVYTTFTKLDIQPKVAYANGPFACNVALKIPSLGTSTGGQGMTLTPDVSYLVIPGLTLEGYCDVGNLNSTTAVSVTPSLKVSYSTKVSF
jgi:hypothetical protein